MINKRRIIIILTSLAIVFGLLAASKVYLNDFIKGPREPNGFFSQNNYKIDPNTVLEKLDQGDLNVFTQVLATPEYYEKSYFSPVPWTQADYLKLARALHQHTGSDTFDKWQVYRMSFYRDCQNISTGFDLFIIIYVKYIDSKKYDAREISISPMYESASMSEKNNLQQPVFGLDNINLDEINVTADTALHIAEENGGRSARLAAENKCRASITSDGQIWFVRYLAQNSSVNSSIFEINVNIYTGKFKILN